MDHGTGRVADREDDPRGGAGAAVGERAIGRGEVERPDLDRPDRAGQAGLEEALRAAGEADAELLGPCGDGVAADALEGTDGRDVQRVLEGLPDQDRAALELVRVARRPARAERRRDVEEEAARGQPLGIEGARVEDRRTRTGLARAVAGGVVFRLELRARELVLVVAGAPGVAMTSPVR
jgi:hypothetical protein